MCEVRFKRDQISAVASLVDGRRLLFSSQNTSSLSDRGRPLLSSNQEPLVAFHLKGLSFFHGVPLPVSDQYLASCQLSLHFLATSVAYFPVCICIFPYPIKLGAQLETPTQKGARFL